MDQLEAISTFVAVADEGGFSAASRRLRVPLATISRRVSDLEGELGAQLLTRTTRKVVLTEIGAQYLSTCRRVLEELDEAKRLAAGEYRAPRGELVVSAPTGLGNIHLMPILTEFLAAYPDIDIDLRLSDHIVSLVDEHIDVALRIGHLEDSGLIAAKIGAVRHVVCASPDYLGEFGEPADLNEMADHVCVTFTAFGTSREWIFRNKDRIVRLPVKSRLAATTAEAAVHAAISGIGITRLLCYQVAQAIGEGRLRLVLRQNEPDPLPVSFIYPSGRLVAQKLKAFLEFVIPRLKARLVFDH